MSPKQSSLLANEVNSILFNDLDKSLKWPAECKYLFLARISKIGPGSYLIRGTFEVTRFFTANKI
jgi:hypothetical protein